ncbi:hypothetical protein KC644_04120 [Candidatus Berkelbacteria bacterium]|nr:hypothetical protein [Candidatus Berkelbacteria bacterium]
MTKQEEIIKEIILAARKIQDFLWGEPNKNWGLEEWKRMFRKRIVKIDDIDPANPHAVIELKKRLLQNAALSVALLIRLDNGLPGKENVDVVPSNLPEYAD